ncbi:hypothetical protein C5167_038495 [Papaver somniferum]|uniref:Nucleotide-diphospho-sugar transferase domain-containing protein n=1 Tax=Papaver somniferum TaxID=3469 RepID=A0A4Y7ICR8_PAPSO|nr:hypothetical protein C5167_038495 [Papaver somniferum]
MIVGSAACESDEKANMLKLKLVYVSDKNAELKKQVLVMGNPHKAGPFGTVKSLRSNLTIVADPSVNPRLAKLLEKVAFRKELIVCLANSNVKEMLERAGIPNYLVVAQDDDIVNFFELNHDPVYKRDPDQNVDEIFHVLRELLRLGYNVLLSDVDIVYLQDPFDHIYRDSDVESMTDGHNNSTTYGFDDVFDEHFMGWGLYAHIMRVWIIFQIYQDLFSI